MGIPVQTTRTNDYPDKEYIPRGQNVLQALFKDHFAEFKEIYDEKYAQIYGNYRTDRITEVVEEFLKCGDFQEGVARIKCQDPKCRHDYFVPHFCLGFYLCPSCHQKRTLLFAEQIAHVVLLRLPHRQFVFAIPKCLRPYFLHNRTLFSDISRLIFSLIQEYYNEVAGKQITTGLVLSHQTFGDFARPNPHYLIGAMRLLGHASFGMGYYWKAGLMITEILFISQLQVLSTLVVSLALHYSGMQPGWQSCSDVK